ncbi:MAG: flagellar assembly protein FliW [Desulfobulbaceae bacterium]|nr:flagellar assembly protein FliW [Desulfobulbaceae bacterium]
MNALNQDTDQLDSEKTIKVQTSRFGEIAVDKDRVITMTRSFLGFPESLHFFLRPHSPNSPFMWLQSLDNPKLAFVVVTAKLLAPHYIPEIPPQLTKELKIDSVEEQDLLLILTIPKDNPQEMTANLLGPVVVNSRKRLAVQVVLDPRKYDPCWPLFPQK